MTSRLLNPTGKTAVLTLFTDLRTLFKCRGALLVLTFVLCSLLVLADDSKVSVALEKTRLAYQMQKWPDVVTAAGELLIAAPEHLEGHFMLAIAEIRLGSHEAAIKRLTWLNFKVADSAVYRYSLAEALFTAGLIDQARTQAQYSVQLAPDEAVYKIFLQRIAEKVKARDGGEYPVATDQKNVESAHQSQNVNQPNTGEHSLDLVEKKTVSKFEKQIKSIIADCEKMPDQEMELILAAVHENPELMSDTNWSLLQKRLDKTYKDPYKEVIRQFLLWNSGEKSLKDYEKFLEQLRVKNLAWKSDVNLLKIAGSLTQYGVVPGRKEESSAVSADSVSWFESLDENVRVAFFDARYDDAWALHSAQPETVSGDLSAYQSARLALELWQLHNFKREWLEIAKTHLEKCVSKGMCRKNSEILLSEVTGILEGKVK